jgi:hypothetical protein
MASPFMCRRHVIGYWLLVIGYWLLVIGYWLLVIGYWLLVIGYWLLSGAKSRFAGLVIERSEIPYRGIGV